MERTVILIIFALLVAACSAQVVQPDEPALLTNPGPLALQEIEQTISAALNSSKVTLAADALTKNSVLVIERLPELGRDLGRPYRFQLFISGSQCVLVDQQSGKRWPLARVECVKE